MNPSMWCSQAGLVWYVEDNYPQRNHRETCIALPPFSVFPFLQDPITKLAKVMPAQNRQRPRRDVPGLDGTAPTPSLLPQWTPDSSHIARDDEVALLGSDVDEIDSTVTLWGVRKYDLHHPSQYVLNMSSGLQQVPAKGLMASISLVVTGGHTDLCMLTNKIPSLIHSGMHQVKTSKAWRIS